MTRIIIDTSAYSAFMRAVDRVKLALQRADQIYLNPIVLGELRAGFLRGGKREKNERELSTFLGSPRVIIVNLDEETGDRYAVIHNALWRAGTPIPTNDIWIAASAMQYGLRILTTDSHYLKVSQVIVDYVAR